LFERELTAREVPVTVESSSTNVLNAELVETCTRYEAAPADAAHDIDNEVGWFVAPLAGNDGTGTAGGATAVAKLQGPPVALVLPPPFFATTFQ
jgi:hypothetical protein